jgi:CRISPR-associated Csx2 family protein
MTKALVGFLGRSPKSEDGYRKTIYRLPDGSSSEPTAVLGWTLLQREQPERMVVLGTAGSMWDFFIESLPLGEDYQDLRLEMMEATASKSVVQELLDRMQKPLTSRLGCDVRLRIVPYGATEIEQEQLLHILAEACSDCNAITLDVTHAFRHLPMIGLLGALYLSAVRGTVIKSILYGFYDPDSDEALVYDLKGLLTLADWVGALAAFDHTGDYGIFADLLTTTEPAGLLRAAAFMERTSRDGQARGQAKRALVALEQKPLGGLARLFEEPLRQRLAWIEEDRMFERQRELARLYLDRGDFIRAAIYAFEAFITRQVQRDGASENSYERRNQAKDDYERSGSSDDYKKLRDLRNALAHGVTPTKGKIQQALASEESLRKELQRLIGTLLA